MGYNSVVLILNDRLSEIEKSPDHFVKEMISAVLRVAHPHAKTKEEFNSLKKHGIDFYPGQSTAITCHHADMTSIIAVGGNCATVLGQIWGGTHHTEEGAINLLKKLADEKGYRLVRKPTKR